MPAVAVTDHGNMFGAFHFFHEALQQGIRPIIGVEAYIAPAERHEPGGAGGERVGGGLRVPPDAPRRDAEGLPEPRAARLRGLPDRLLSPPPHGQGAPARARGGADRPLGVPEGGGRGGPLARQLRGREGGVPRVRGDLRPRELLRRDHGPRPAPADRDRARPAAPLAGDRRAGRGDERQPLSAPRRRLPARGPPVHRHGQDARGRAADALLQRRVLREGPGRDEGAIRDLERGGGVEHRRDRRALRRLVRDRRAAPADLHRSRRAAAGRILPRPRRARGSSAASRSCRPRTPPRSRRRSTGSVSRTRWA